MFKDNLKHWKIKLFLLTHVLSGGGGGGGLSWGDIVRGDIVRGDIVLEPPRHTTLPHTQLPPIPMGMDATTGP